MQHTAYDIWESVSLTACALITPAAVGIYGAQAAGTSVARAVGVQYGKTLISGGAGYLTNAVGEHYGLSKEARFALGMGVGMLTGFGLEGIDKHFNISGYHRVSPVTNGGSKVSKEWRIVDTQDADNVNSNFSEIGYESPYKPGTQTSTIELTQKTKTGEYVRVYDNVNSNQAGGWVMKADDIKGLTPQQIQSKFSLPSTPTHVTDVIFESGTHLRTGSANSLFGFEGGGVQFDMMGQRAGQFINGRLLP